MAHLNFFEKEHLGLKRVGKSTLISDKAVFHNPGKISIGEHCRIDDFAVLSAGEEGIEIGDYVHISCYVALIGKKKITIKDFAGLSSRVIVYSSSDTYDGTCLTGPCVPVELTKVIHAPVTLGKHVVIGTGSVILPGITLGDGCAVGAMSFVTTSFPDNHMIKGIPATSTKKRKLDIYRLEQKIKRDAGTTSS